MATLLQALVIALLCTKARQGMVTRARGNIIFDKVKEISISRASWKVTYIIDMTVYDNLFEKSFQHLDKAATEVWRLIQTATDERINFDPQYRMLHRQLEQINITKNQLLDTLDEYKSLRPRHERSLLGFGGDILHFLFGVSTESSMNDVRQAINDLSDNQQKFKHIINQSLTLVSNTHESVKENRERINGVISSLKQLHDQVANNINNTEGVTQSIITFLTYYPQLSTVAGDLQELLLESLRHIDNLRAQIDMLAAGKLTPSVIGPIHLRQVLREISRKLPNDLLIPINTRRHLWEFYTQIGCTAAFERNRVLIVLDIPLTSVQNKYDVVKSYNMPLPNTAMFKINTESIFRPKQMVAQYEIENEIFVIDKTRTKYILLTEEEARDCLGKRGGFCEIRSAIYTVGPNPRTCVIALYLGDDKKIPRACKTKIKPNCILPQAKNIDAGHWLVSTLHPITFTINCNPQSNRKRGQTSTMTVQPPIFSVTLPPNCAATSQHITLPPFYELKSMVYSRPSVQAIFHNSSINLWKPLYDKYPSFNDSWDLTPLKDVNEMQMGDLLNQLDTVNKVHVEKKAEKWGWQTWLVVITISLFVLGIIFFICKANIVGLRQLYRFIFGNFQGNQSPQHSDVPEEIPLKASDQEPRTEKNTPTAPNQESYVSYHTQFSPEADPSLIIHPVDKFSEEKSVQDSKKITINPNLSIYPRAI